MYSADWLGTEEPRRENPDRDGPLPWFRAGIFAGGHAEVSIRRGSIRWWVPILAILRPGFSLSVKGADGVLDLRWVAVPEAAYSVWATPELECRSSA